MLKRLSIYLTFSIGLLLYSCQKDGLNGCVNYTDRPVGQVSGPETISLGETVNYDVVFYVLDGCGQFYKFKDDKHGSTIEIKIVAKYQGCGCTADVPARYATYSFRPKKRGTYNFKFSNLDGTYETKTLKVQ